MLTASLLETPGIQHPPGILELLSHSYFFIGITCYHSLINHQIRDEGAGYTPSPAKRPRCRDYDEKGFCLRGDLCKFDHGSDAVVLEDAGGKVESHPSRMVQTLPIFSTPFSGVWLSAFPSPARSLYSHARTDDRSSTRVSCYFF